MKEDEKRSYYNRSSIWGDNYWTNLQLERAKETVKILPNEINSVLEVGCGAGIVSHEVKRKSFNIISIDFAFIPLKQLKSLEIPCIQGDALYLPFRDNTFDAVIATELIEHLTELERRQVLKEIERVSKRFILVTVPYREVLASGLVKCIDCGCIFHSSRHTKSFDISDMNFLFRPKFNIKQVELFGPRLKRIPQLFIMLAQLFGGYKFPNTNSIECPQCKNSKKFLSKKNWFTLFFLGVPSRVLPLRKFPNWMGALYEKCSN